MLALSADEGVAAFIGKEESKAASRVSIYDLDLPKLLYSRLGRHGIGTIGDLLPLSYKGILDLEDVGPRFVAKLRAQLEERGIILREE